MNVILTRKKTQPTDRDKMRLIEMFEVAKQNPKYPDLLRVRFSPDLINKAVEYF